LIDWWIYWPVDRDK